MTAQPVDDAIAVHRELGWDRLTLQQLPTADLGTADQRRRARAGCRSGVWADWGQTSPNNWGMVNHLGSVDLPRFVVFAIRMGVDARRAASILDLADVPADVLFPVLLERGPAFCTQFVERVSTSRRRMNDWTPTKWGTVTVRVVAELRLDIPDNEEYLQDWAGCAYLALTPRQPGETLTWSRMTIPPEEAVTPRFAEHVRASVAAGLQLTGPLLPACQLGLGRGLLERQEMVDLSFAGLDRARRPGERAAWVTFLVDDLRITDAEILERAEELIPALATGSREVVEQFGVVLLARAPDELLVDLVASALPAVTSRRLRTLIVDTLAARDRPDPAVVKDVADVLAGFDEKAIPPKSRAALESAWAMGTVEPAPVPDVQATWRPTPPVWSVPRFETGPATPDTLTEPVRIVVAAAPNTMAWTAESERVLALIVGCAAQDVAATRTALRGVPDTLAPGLRRVAAWVRGESIDEDWSDRMLSGARESAVMDCLGELPCLLSEPSWDDLRIDAADLAQRLGRYASAGVDACEADLLLALARLDFRTITPELRAVLEDSPVGVRLRDGTRRTGRGKWWKRLGGAAPGAAGQLARLWLQEPIPEPVLINHGGTLAWRPVRPAIPPALQEHFSRFIDKLHYPAFPFWEFPTWSDAAMGCFGSEWQTDSGEGPLLRQLVRRGETLPPGASINLLGAQRNPHTLAAADTQQAVVDAFDRGLLRPGGADVRYLDWSDSPRNLASFGTAMRELAEVGLLSVVWPVLDDLIALSAAASTVLSGTEVLADVVLALLPSVRAAVESGLIDSSVLALPGVRNLAARSGSGLAVRAAREIVAGLPTAAESDGAAETPVGRPFEGIWPAGIGRAPAIDDRSTVSVRRIPHQWQPHGLEVTLQYEKWPDRTFVVAGESVVQLMRTGRIVATQASPKRERVALHWDPRKARMVRSAADTALDADTASDAGTLTGIDRRPLSNSLVAVALAGLHEVDASFAAELLQRFEVGVASVEMCLPLLLASPDVDPSRLARVVEQAPSTLPALWPLVTEPVRLAGGIDGPLPRWVGTVLSVAVGVAPHLAEAVRRGLAPVHAAQWRGLDRIAARPGKSVAVVKAQQLLALIRSDAR
ncbi:MAG: hypothetical protein WKF57_01380 [Nakamurella sp.]